MIAVGISRNLVTEDGTIFPFQRREDIFRIKAPRADEFLSHVWMQVDGLLVLSIPLTIVPAILV